MDYGRVDASAQSATATPDIQQGVQSETKRTATELSLQNQKLIPDTHSLQRFSGGQKSAFGSNGTDCTREYFKEGIDEKVVRVVGALAHNTDHSDVRILSPNTDLDVSVESRVLSEAKQFNKARNFEGYLTVIAQDPTANLRYGFKHLGKLKGLKKDEIDLLLPPTIEELRANDENKRLEG